MLTITRRILGQFRNDKRSLGLLLGAPLLVLSLLYFILGDAGYTPKVVVMNMPAVEISVISKTCQVETVNNITDKKTYLEEEGKDAVLWADQKGIHVFMLEKNSKTAQVTKALSKMATSAVKVEYAYTTNESNQLDSLSFVFLGVLSFFFIFILSGIAFVGERTKQTLERMLMAPLRRVEVIGGYTIGYGLLATVQSVLTILFAVYVLNLHFEGSILLCMMVMVLMSFAAVSVGSLLSIFANNELQMVQCIPIVIIPQIFFSGLIPLDTIPFYLGNLCYLSPSYYSCAAMQKIIVYGKGWNDIWLLVVELVCYTLVLFAINVVALKKYRKL